MRKVALLLCGSAIAIALAGPASAQYPGTTSTTGSTTATSTTASTTATIAPAVLGESLSRPSAAVQPTVAERDADGLLPRTGAAILRWTTVAAALLVVGAAFVVGGRRRHREGTGGL